MKQFNYSEYLKSLLDEKYYVTEELNFSLSKLPKNKVAVIVKQLSGSADLISAQIPYELDIYTDNVSETLKYFTEFAKTYNKSVTNGFFGSDDNLKQSIITFKYDTPTAIENDIASGNRLFSKIVCFSSMFVMKDLGNVKSLKIDDEEQDFINGNITYTTEFASIFKSNSNIAKSVVKKGTVTLSFSLLSQENLFIRKLSKLRTGKLKGNNMFKVNIVLTNNVEEEYLMIVTNHTFAFARNLMPTYQVTLNVAESEI